MTRFARAKGSKSSNEKRPEEATSWLEMKRSMLSKPLNQRFNRDVQIENNKPETVGETKWASLGEEGSLLKPKTNVSQGTDVGKQAGTKIKKKKLNSDIEIETLSSPLSVVDVKKNKKKQVESSMEVSNNLSKNNKVNKKEKKKKLSGINSENFESDDAKTLKKGKKKKLSEINSENLRKSVISNCSKKGKKRKLSDLDSENLGESSKKKKLDISGSLDSNNIKESKKKNKKVKEIEKSPDVNLKSKNVKEKKKKSENFKKESASASTTSKEPYFKKKNKPQFELKQFNGKFDKKFYNKFNNKRNNNRNYSDNRHSEVIDEILVNGEKVAIVKFQGFPVTQDDAERLKKLRVQMIKEGIPRDRLEGAIKLERRRAEKALSRLKKAVCFHCRGSGHLLSNCPMLTDKVDTSTGICYKCGSTEHSALECKVVKGTNYQFAECFICKEQGHIARQCPDNPRGLYPQGGACRECGDVTHLRKDCPKVLGEKLEETITVGIRNERNLECLDEEIAKREREKEKKPAKKKLKVKF